MVKQRQRKACSTYDRACPLTAFPRHTLYVTVLLALVSQCHTRKVPSPALDEYCPKVPAAGQLKFKSVDSAIATCAPSAHDVVGQAIYDCWRQFSIVVNGCQVSMRTNASRFVGPGRMPCRFFNVAGNLTEDGVEAQMWAQVDGPGLFYYYTADPQAVAALRFESAAQLVKDIWAFLRDFTADPRFNDVHWLDAISRKASGAADPKADPESEADLGRRALLVVDAAGSPHDAGLDLDPELHLGLDLDRAPVPSPSPGGKPGKRGPMRVYRPSAGRVAVKVPTGCKYRYTINPDSHVFEPPSRQRMVVAWRAVLLTAAGMAVLLSVVGLGACTYFSRRHALYVASYWEYQAVKDQLGSELPPDSYKRLPRGEAPPNAAAAAAAPAAGLPAAPTPVRQAHKGAS